MNQSRILGAVVTTEKEVLPEAGTRASEAAPRKDLRLRNWWWKQIRTWHWVSSAISLAGMLLFAVTGITLNHAGSITAQPRIRTVEQRLPEDLRLQLQMRGAAHSLPPELVRWAKQKTGADLSGRPVEWQGEELYVALPRPGGDGWLTLSPSDGRVHYEVTDRGWIAYLNDLHKGRNTGRVWSWFLDVFAGACIIFCTTGLLLLYLHARSRPFTWPAVALGFFLPLVLILLFIHS